MVNRSVMDLRGLKVMLGNFFLGEYFRDALRNTLTIILPIVVGFSLNHPDAAIGIGIGALLISLTDLPGNKRDKLRTAMISTGSFVIGSFITAWSLQQTWMIASALFLLTFVFSMFSVFGNRTGTIGTVAIILCTFTLGLHPHHPLLFGLFILIGSLWYHMVSLLQVALLPYRSLNYAIFECLNSTAVFLNAKAKCYDPEVDLETCYQESITLHVRVTEKQDVVRSLLLNDRRAMDPANEKGQRLLKVAKTVILLYEQGTAIHYDYEFIRSTLKSGGSLPQINHLIMILAAELKNLSQLFLQGRKSIAKSAGMAQFESLMAALEDTAGKESKINASIIYTVLQNLRAIHHQIEKIKSDELLAFEDEEDNLAPFAYQVFLPDQPFKIAEIKSYLSFRSPVFRFSLRLALSFLGAYLLSFFFHYTIYSYWMLLTIVIVARPRFAITLKRNKERLIGTFVGAFIGVLIVLLIQQTWLLLLISVLFLLGFFAFNRVKYAVSVTCITPAVIICLGLYQGHTDQILSERIYYTIAGCLISIVGVYLFPIWESTQMKTLVSGVVKGNITYLEEVLNFKKGKTASINVGLARKKSHEKLAKFSETVQFMLLEPFNKVKDRLEVQEIQAINYRINSVITSLFIIPQKEQCDLANNGLYLQIMDNLNACQEDEAGLLSVLNEEGGVPSDEVTLNHLYALSQELKKNYYNL